MENDELYKDLLMAEEEERKILAEIDQVLKSTPDRKVAEKIVLEKYAPRMDEAMKNSGEALNRWLNWLATK